MSRHGARWSTSSFSFPIHGINKLLGLGARDRDPLTTTTTPPPALTTSNLLVKKKQKKAGKTHISSNTKQITTMRKCRKLMIRKQLRVSNTMIYLVKLHPLCTMLRDMMETLYHVDFAWQWTNWPTGSFEQIRMNLSHWENWTNLRKISYVTNWPRDHPLKTTK